MNGARAYRRFLHYKINELRKEVWQQRTSENLFKLLLNMPLPKIIFEVSRFISVGMPLTFRYHNDCYSGFKDSYLTPLKINMEPQ